MTETTAGIPVDFGDKPALGISVSLTNDAKTQIGFMYASQVHRPGMPSWQNLGSAQRDRYFADLLDNMLNNEEVLKSVGAGFIDVLKIDTIEKANALCEGIIGAIEDRIEGI